MDKEMILGPDLYEYVETGRDNKPTKKHAKKLQKAWNLLLEHNGEQTQDDDCFCGGTRYRELYVKRFYEYYESV